MASGPVLGLDLSLTATGIVVAPYRWGLDWGRIEVAKAGFSLKQDASELERANRLRAIVRQVVQVVVDFKPTVAVLEQYAFSSQASQAHALGELGGAVKVQLVQMGVQLSVVPPASARKLLGKAPRKDVKTWAHQRLYAAGAPKWWTGDQLDAFVVANYFLSGAGGDAVILAEAA